MFPPQDTKYRLSLRPHADKAKEPLKNDNITGWTVEHGATGRGDKSLNPLPAAVTASLASLIVLYAHKSIGRYI